MDCPSCGLAMRDDARICLSCGEVVRSKVAPADRLTAAPAGVPSWIAFDAPQHAEPLSYPASRLQRIFAAAVDSLILSIPGVIIAAVTGRATVELSESGHLSFNGVLIAALVAIGAVYMIGFPASKWQGTPGKRLLGLRIVDTDYQPITLLQSVGRWACQQLIFLVVIPLGMMVALFGFIAVPIAILILCGDGRSPWDRMAGTMVVD